MKLATEFAAWEEQLQRFPEELALGLAPMLRQLWAAIGSEGAHVEGKGEPDGISGVVQRGRYEQLLASQWLLASEVPMEFLRRAAMQELLFLQVATRERASSRRCLLVLDAGPSQLGAPRLVHLAMLLVLERRARRTRAQLQWATLQEPSLLRSSCEQHDIEALLQSRSSQEPTTAHIVTLQQRLGPLAHTDELIWVGGERFCRLAAQVGGQRLQLKDPLSRENNEIIVLLQSNHRRREFALKLPSPEVRTRLIRRPFQVQAQRQSPPPGGTETGDLRFSADGRRILVRQGNTISAHLPMHAESYRPKTVTARPGTSIVGFGWHNKVIMALSQNEGELSLHWAGKTSDLLFTNRRFVTPEDGTTTCRVVALARKSPRLFVCDAEGTLFAGKLQTTARVELKAILENVLHLRLRNGLLAYARAAAPDVVEVGTISAELELGVRQSIVCKEPPVVVSGFDRVTRISAVAVQVERNIAAEGGQAGGPGGIWEIISVGYANQSITLDDLDEAVACIPRATVEESASKSSSTPSTAWSMLVHSLGDDCLYATSDGFRRKLHKIATPDSPLQWDENTSRVMYRECSGRVQVLDIGAKRPSFSFEPSVGVNP